MAAHSFRVSVDSTERRTGTIPFFPLRSGQHETHSINRFAYPDASPASCMAQYRSPCLEPDVRPHGARGPIGSDRCPCDFHSTCITCGNGTCRT